jgi:DNA-binding MarR family transcriptional regulator
VTAPDLNSTCRAIVDGRRAARMLADCVRQFDLTEPEFLVLWCLRDATADGVDQTTIAHWLALSPAQVSATVERMNSQNWIVQHTSLADRRRRLWQMSSTGRALWNSMLAGIVSVRQMPPGREAAA